jgi:NifU-like protein involved in Fe-S cluster formation
MNKTKSIRSAAKVCPLVIGKTLDEAQEIIFAAHLSYRALSFDGKPCRIDPYARYMTKRVSLHIVNDVVTAAEAS